MSDRVLVALDREAAAHLWEQSVHGVHGGLDVADATSDAFRAALDTDREELEARVAAELYRQGVKFEGSMSERVEHAAGTARAVLALLENGGQE